MAWLAIAGWGCATTRTTPATAPSPLPGSAPAQSSAPASGSQASSHSPSPLPGTPVGTTASGGRIVSTSPAAGVIDTLPSGDARAVLETIPEPLSPSERVASPKSGSGSGAPAGAGAAAGAAAAGAASAVGGAVPTPRDTTARDSTAADTSASDADAPVPEPTHALGDRPAPTAQAGAPPPPPPAAAPERAAPDTCWRIQVAAVPEEKRAATLRTAAESQLDGRWVVEKEAKLFKVRSRDCLHSAEADALKKRAVADGFTGAFRFRAPKP